jgi:hypothetical protein
VGENILTMVLALGTLLAVLAIGGWHYARVRHARRQSAARQATEHGRRR